MKRGPPFRDYILASPGAGAYRVQLVGEDPRHVASALFAGSADIQSVSLPPGQYTALIEPVGGAARLVQTIKLASQTAPVRLRDDPPGLAAQPSPTTRRSRLSVEAKLETRAVVNRRFEIGISVDRLPGSVGGWEARRPRLSIAEQPGGGIAMVLRRPGDWREFPRWRLTIAVENDPLWRVPLPLFEGGLQILLRPLDTPTGPDFALSLSPRRAPLAALVAELESAFADDIHLAVATGLGLEAEAHDLGSHVQKTSDPWAATAAALVLTRTEDLDLALPCIEGLRASYPWMPDICVLSAWRRALIGGDQDQVERQCFALIVEARDRGAPYFTPTDALAHELLSALATTALDPRVKAAAGLEQAEWLLRSRNRMRTEPYLTWEDRSPLPESGDRLLGPDYMILTSGVVQSGRIFRDEKPVDVAVLRSVRHPPGLLKPVARDDDPQWGRWGRRSTKAGYALSAEFGRGPDEWTPITLTVRAPPGSKAQAVELFLHDTFDPDHVVVAFEDGVAEYAMFAYGGFTVGAWIQEDGVQLELDLSKVKRAPRNIREL